jgi:hypothetical protein
MPDDAGGAAARQLGADQVHCDRNSVFRATTRNITCRTPLSRFRNHPGISERLSRADVFFAYSFDGELQCRNLASWVQQRSR